MTSAVLLSFLVLLLSSTVGIHGSFAQTESDPVREAIRDRVEHLHSAEPLVVGGGHIVSTVILPEIYDHRHFRPAWMDTAKVHQLLDAVRTMDGDGLVPADYHLAELERLLGRPAPSITPFDIADFDLLATDSFILVLYHLYLGKTDPKTLFTHWNFGKEEADRIDAAKIIGDAMEAGTISDTITRARPEHRFYDQGRKLLAEYRAIAAAGGWPPVPAGEPLKLGVSDERVPALAKRLAVTGDLEVEPAGSNLFDETIEAGVKRFQSRHGLTADGVAGKATVDAMNVPVEARIDQTRVNLELGRWVLHEIKDEFVLADIAGFDVTYFRDHKPIFRSRAQVGKPFRESPVFKDEIEYVVFNPTWTVPPGIMKDLAPKIIRDPNYLKKHNMRRVNGQIVQSPGPNNSLGLVKIMFPNPYLVYLHDTPSKPLFEEDQRAFSSGCIRVERPLELAELLLDDAAQWNEDSIRKVIASGKTTTAMLKHRVPVLLLYWTVDFGDDSRPRFRPDIYKRDAPVLKALEEDFQVGKRPTP
jgi:murein L,D-transpeptidase YcbB/YkuD